MGSFHRCQKGRLPRGTGGTREDDHFHAASLPMSLLRNAQKNGTVSSVTHVLPTTCPTRNSREPKAKARKITESRTVPTRFDGIIAQSQNRFLRGVYTPKSASSENRKATPVTPELVASRPHSPSEGSLRPLLSPSLIHRSAWKKNSANFACRAFLGSWHRALYGGIMLVVARDNSPLP